MFQVTPSSPMFGLDCEFVIIAKDNGTTSALGSISIVNEHGGVVYKTLVQPDAVIVDYATRWSGLTEKLLSPVTTTLLDVQTKIRKFLPPDAILVGHSLDSDLKVMQVSC